MLFNKKNKILNYGSVLAILVCFLLFFSNFVKAAASRNYQIGLPQKTTGIDKVEYLINGIPQGSTDGIKYKSIESGSRINFLIKFDNFYADSKIGDFKIVSESGVDSFIRLYVYDYDTTGNIITREVDTESTVDPKQTYITSSITVTGPEILGISLNGQAVKRDVVLKLNSENGTGKDAIDSNARLSDILDVKYYTTVDGTKQQQANVIAENDGNITLKGIPYNSEVEIEASTKVGYKFESSIINAENFGTSSQVTPQAPIDGKKMTIKVRDFQIKTTTSNPSITFKNIVKNNGCTVSYNGNGSKSYENYFDWYEPVEGKENVIRQIESSPQVVQKGKYTFYVRHKTSDENKYTLMEKREKIITLDGAEIDPTFDGNEGKFEKYTLAEEKISDNQNISIKKELGETTKHNFMTNNNGEYYKFEVYLTEDSASLGMIAGSGMFRGNQTISGSYNRFISFDESYTNYAEKPKKYYVTVNRNSLGTTTRQGTYGGDGGEDDVELKLNEAGLKKFGFSKPNIYFVPTDKISSLKSAISRYEDGTDSIYDYSELKNYEDYLAQYESESSYKYLKTHIEEPRTVILGPVVGQAVAFHTIEFPTSVENVTLSVDTSESVKKFTNGYLVRCEESAQNAAHQNTFSFTAQTKPEEKFTVNIGSESYTLEAGSNTSNEANFDKFEITQKEETDVDNKTSYIYTCTLTNINKDLKINIEKYTEKPKVKEIKFNCPGVKIVNEKDAAYNFSHGGTISLNSGETSYKFKTELKENFELKKDQEGTAIPLTVKIGDEELALNNDFYTISWEKDNYDPITVDITGAVFKTEPPYIEIITTETGLEYYHYTTKKTTHEDGSESEKTELTKVSTTNPENGNAIISNSDLTPGGNMTFYIVEPLSRFSAEDLTASILGSEITKLSEFKKLSSQDNDPAYESLLQNNTKAIYKVTVNNMEENCKLSIYNPNQSDITHYWTLTKSFEIVSNVNPGNNDSNIIEGKFQDSEASTIDINFQKDDSGEFNPSPGDFKFDISSVDDNIYPLEKGNYECKFYSDKELTKEIDVSNFENGSPILSSDDTQENFKWRINILNRNFESSIPASSEYITVKGQPDYTKKVDYVYDKIYVGIVLKPLNEFNIHFSYNINGNSEIISYSKPNYSNYKGIRVTNITATPKKDEDNGQIITYDIVDNSEFDPKTDTKVSSNEKSFAISWPEGFLYDDIVVSSSKIENVPMLPQENTALSKLFKYPVVSDLGSKDSFRIDNVYSKDIYVHVKNLKQRQLKVGFPEQYMEGTDIHLMETDDDGNLTEASNTIGTYETVGYGEELKIRSRAKEGYSTDEISEFILYTPSGLAYTFIYKDGNIQGPDSKNTESSNWTVRSGENLSKIVDEIRYKFSIDKGEPVFDIEFKGVKSNFDVQLRRKKKNFTISFPAQNDNITVRNLNGEEIAGPVSKSYKDSFSFSITPAEGVDITNLVVKDTEENVYNLINGYYTISSVEKDITIRILGIGKETRTITFTDYDDISYLDANNKTIAESVNVQYDSNYEFKINFGDSISQLKDDSSKIKIHLTNSASGEENDEKIEYDYKSHRCLIKNLKENSKITIEGITLNTYTLTFNKPDNISYTEAYSNSELESDSDYSGKFSDGSIRKKITHGSNFSFRVAGKEGVDLSNLKVWLKKSENDKSPTQIVAIDSIYTVENIQGDYIVYTSDSKPTVYTVEIRTTTGVSCLDKNGNTIAAKTEVDYDGTLEFRLSIDKIYDKSNPVVEIKGTTSTLSQDSDGYYRLKNIKENKILQITGITKNTYKVTFEETEGVIYKTVKNKPFEKSMNVEYGDTLQFKITLMDAYDSSVPAVLLNDTAEISSNAGTYEVQGINSDVTISVKNVNKNPEERAIEEITTVKNEISSSADVDEIISATNSYNNLSDDQKDLVTNLDELNAAQKSAGVFNHSSDGVTVTGIDWYIKLVVTSLNDDEEAIEELNGHLDRKELINLYDIKLYDMLQNEVYKVPYGQEVTVTIPCPENINDYENIMVVHENSAGGIEYLDVNITSGTAQFKTTSFSKFGIAGKKIPLASNKLTDATVSVSSLVENEDELNSLLGENAASEIGELINTDDENEDDSENNLDGSNGSNSSESSEGQNKENLKDKVYNWAVKNELPAVIIVLILGFGILALILIPILKKKSNDKQEKK